MHEFEENRIHAGLPVRPDRSGKPLGLLIVSTCAASVVTLLYSILLVRLNTADLPAAIRLGGCGSAACWSRSASTASSRWRWW
jgi:hypothetical protein